VGAPFSIGRLKDHPSELIERRLESSAYGENKFNQVSTPGMLDLDLMQAVKRSHKLSSYSLNSVAEEFLGEHKLDMHFRRMLDIYEEGTPEGIAEVAKYFIQDTALPLKISDKLNLLFAQIEMAKATFVPISYLINRGQQVCGEPVPRCQCRLAMRKYQCQCAARAKWHSTNVLTHFPPRSRYSAAS
jgi:DNA polymerase delta subunit 1